MHTYIHTLKKNILYSHISRKNHIVIIYIHNFSKHSSADSDDLFNAIYEVAKTKNVIPQNLKTIMEEWVNKEGYPVVTVTRDYNKTGDITLEQERFLLVKQKQQDKTQWWIPINYVTEGLPAINNTKPSHWLKPKETLKIDKLNVTHWMLLNNNQTGVSTLLYISLAISTLILFADFPFLQQN